MTDPLPSDLFWESPELLHLFHQVWDTASSEEILEQVRSGNDCTPPQALEMVDQYYYDQSMLSSSPIANDALLDVPIHPLFKTFFTDLPMEEVEDVFRPALQLATMFLTSPAALQWFVDVGFGTVKPTAHGLGTIVPASGSPIDAAIGLVKAELIEIAKDLRISFLPFSGIESLAELKGFTVSTPYEVVRTLELLLGRDTPGQFYEALSEGETYCQCPTIFLNLDFFYEAMEYGYSKDSSKSSQTFDSERVLQFLVGHILVHEIAHIWTTRFHSTDPIEPLCSELDVIPEAGLSWE
jgi:hypothetical protein